MRMALALTFGLLSAPAALSQEPPSAIPPEALAAARRPVVLTLPGMDAVQVTRDLRYTSLPEGRLAMDVYRPAGLAAGERRPAVIYIHGGVPPGAPAKEMGVYQSYGRLAAAQGWVGVTFTHRLGFPKTMIAEGAADVASAVAYVRSHAAELNVDVDRLCLAAYSAGGPMLSPFLKDAPAYVRCLVAYYPILDIENSAAHRAAETPQTLAAHSPLRQLAAPGRKPPLFLARAGGDEIPDLLAGLDAFVAEALTRDYPLTLANNPGAPHGFDITEPTPRTLEILEATFAFMRRHLGR
ncbi:alpha/beta hydrolase [uncultured Phenylobacterium sp.]|uniref:alpha/beta hydrolase n=1 Tax=uncultured Phenylobacterium sp. TaxID=349273 RepID=UPI0025E34758|nr:alpha/beta hydrolase [uncultured Phenylobacterium sp.]